MKRWAVVFGVLVASSPMHAQTDSTLAEAVDFYRQLQVELARDIFLQLISPSYPFEISTEQRVNAYLYSGASYAIVQQPDTADIYFRAALERDAFADLDPQVFAALERDAFAESKRRTYRVGIRQLFPDTLDPRTEQMSMSLVSTHEGQTIVQVNSFTENLSFPLFSGQSEGLRQIQWNGTLPDGTLIPPGSYELVVFGQSDRSRSRQDSVRVLFDIFHEFEALEDTIAALPADSLLAERHPGGVAVRELAFGLGIAASALLIPRAFGTTDLGSNGTQAAVVAGVGVLGGIVAFAVRSSNPELPANVAENIRRQAARLRLNQGIATRNQIRLAATQIVILPTTGVLR